MNDDWHALSSALLVAMGTAFCLSGLAQTPAKPVTASAKTQDAGVPTSWGAFQASSVKADEALVKQINGMKWYDACAAWGREARSMKNERRRMALMLYLREDKLINGMDLANVPGPLPQTGMTACGSIALLGMPTKVNNTERSGRLSAQWVYRERGIYVYVEGTPDNHNGTVRSVQY
jgi:hypothetical protein